MRALPRKLFLILALVAGFVQGEPCNSATDCTGCYQVSGCKWCLDEDEEFPGISKGCMKNTIDCSKVIEPRWKEPEPDKHPQEHLSNKEIKVTVAPHNVSQICFINCYMVETNVQKLFLTPVFSVRQNLCSSSAKNLAPLGQNTLSLS